MAGRSGCLFLKSTARDDLGVAGRPVGQFGLAAKTEPLVEVRRLEVVGHHPYGLAATNDSLGDRSLQQASPQTSATLDFIHPELLDLGHTSPTVTGDRTYLDTLFVKSYECQSFAVARSRR